MKDPVESHVRKQLMERRAKLEGFTAGTDQMSEQAQELICQVDAALDRMKKGTYGICEACHEAVETDRLLADPLVQVCVGCLTPAQQRALEADLELASQIQKTLLPEKIALTAGWEVAYHYEGAGVTSGDYCDLIPAEGGQLYLLVGDVRGKGLAASILMAHLHATFRALVSLGLPLGGLLERASRAFCESTLPTYFATLVCMRADPSGRMEIGNAGHPPPLLARGGNIEPIEATGLPLGLFCNEQFSVQRESLSPGDTFLLYTDGFSEAMDDGGALYGADRIADLLQKHHQLAPRELISTCLDELEAFRSGTTAGDDLTIMAIRRK